MLPIDDSQLISRRVFVFVIAELLFLLLTRQVNSAIACLIMRRNDLITDLRFGKGADFFKVDVLRFCGLITRWQRGLGERR
jgi:hypothetical protein